MSIGTIDITGLVKVPGSNPDGSDSRVIALGVALGSFKYVLEGVFCCDNRGNKKTVFGSGETVYFRARFQNQGDAEAQPIISIYDNATKLKGYGFSRCKPGTGLFINPMIVGTMPAKDWTLRFKLTP